MTLFMGALAVAMVSFAAGYKTGCDVSFKYFRSRIKKKTVTKTKNTNASKT